MSYSTVVREIVGGTALTAADQIKLALTVYGQRPELHAEFDSPEDYMVYCLELINENADAEVIVRNADGKLVAYLALFEAVDAHYRNGVLSILINVALEDGAGVHSWRALLKRLRAVPERIVLAYTRRVTATQYNQHFKIIEGKP